MPTTDTPAPSSNAASTVRLAALIAMLCLIGAAAWMMLFTQSGSALRHPREMRDTVDAFVAQHRLTAPIIFVLVYGLFATLALPVWWLQLIAGMAFGLAGGVIYSQIASTISAVVAARFSHWLAADLMHRLEAKLERLRSLDQTFGNNGLLVVMAVRLTHVLPFGLSNYSFGLTTMRTRDIAWGTLLGGLPAAAGYVALGVGDKPLTDWRYVVGLVVLNILLLIPLAVHYLWNRE